MWGGYRWQSLFRGGFFPAQRILSAAISAIDIALWDIKGKALGVPVYELLGGRVRDKVVCYPHHASSVEACLQAKEEGWQAGEQFSSNYPTCAGWTVR